MGCGSSSQTAPQSTGRGRAEPVSDNTSSNGGASRPTSQKPAASQAPQANINPPPAAPTYKPPKEEHKYQQQKTKETQPTQQPATAEKAPVTENPVTMAIQDAMIDKEKTGEEPKKPLPEGEVGDGLLGISVRFNAWK